MDLIRNIERTLGKLCKELKRLGGNAAEIKDMKCRMVRKNFQYYECLHTITATIIIHCQLNLSLATQLIDAWELIHSYQYMISGHLLVFTSVRL